MEVLAVIRQVEPPIWRRLGISGDLRLHDLHSALQAAFGWDDRRWYEFRAADGRLFRRRKIGDKRAPINPRATLLRTALPDQGSEILYVYGVGERWEADIQVTKMTPGLTCPACLDGEGAGPPEGCDGPARYAALVEALANPTHRAHAQARERFGAFDPASFDLKRTNTKVRHHFLSR